MNEQEHNALQLCVESLDQLLPYLAKVPADVGLLNDALMAARPLLKQEPAPARSGDDMFGAHIISGVVATIDGREIGPGHVILSEDRYKTLLAAYVSQAEQQPEPAPAKDERETFEQAFVIQEGVYWSEDHQSYRSMNGRAIEDRDAIDATMWWAGWKARAALARPAQTEQQPAYVECRECTDCGHVGINDAHQTDATCAMCDWSGPSPVEDQCPDCGKENVMGAACPKCSGRYRILAETHR